MLSLAIRGIDRAETEPSKVTQRIREVLNSSVQGSAATEVCTILIVLTAAMSASAGLGGGGVYVPLTVLLVRQLSIGLKYNK